MKRILTAIAMAITLFTTAQTTEKENLKKTEEAAKIGADKPNGWVKKGTFTFLANQSTFTNWQAGGQSNFSGNIGVNYDFNYKKDTWNWDNKFIAGYGITKIKDAEAQKTDDRLELNSLLGKKAFGNWFYSAFFNGRTQMDSGFDPANRAVRNSHFLSPTFLQFGPGMLWKKSDNLKFNFAPATTKVIYVDKQFTVNGSAFGVEQGRTNRVEFGAAVNGYYKFNVMENVSVENIVNLYTNYSEDVQNVDLDYQLNIVMKINKYLSTNFAFQTLYDDNAFTGFQTRQVIGLGVNYGF
jgi:hypothetical protein